MGPCTRDVSRLKSSLERNNIPCGTNIRKTKFSLKLHLTELFLYFCCDQKLFCKQQSVPYGRHFDVVLRNLRVREVRAEIFGNCSEPRFSLSFATQHQIHLPQEQKLVRNGIMCSKTAWRFVSQSGEDPAGIWRSRGRDHAICIVATRTAA
jgi:hypothetical protein